MLAGVDTVTRGQTGVDTVIGRWRGWTESAGDRQEWAVTRVLAGADTVGVQAGWTEPPGPAGWTEPPGNRQGWTEPPGAGRMDEERHVISRQH